MAKTVVGLFDTFSEARNAVQDLVDMGIARDQISLVASDARGELGLEREQDEGSAAAEGAGAGAVGGTLAGGALGLLIGTGLLAIPGIGPVLAAGPLAAAIGTASAALGATALGAGIGAATGGLLGGLIGAGVPESEAHTYTEGVRRGGTLVSVNADDLEAERVRDAMLRHGAIDIDRRSAEWRADGWEGRTLSGNDRSGDSTGEDWQDSSKVGTGTGTVAGAATGAAIGAAGGPVGAVIGGVAGAAAGAAGERAEDSGALDPDRDRGYTQGTSASTGTTGMNRGLTQPESGAMTRADDITQPSGLSGADDSGRDSDYARGLRHGEPTSHPDYARGLDSGESGGHSDFARGMREGSEPTAHSDFARGMRQFSDFDNDFRSHYSTMGVSSRSYGDYEPAYRFGHEFADDRSYGGSSWNDVETHARQRWERDNPNTWEQMKDSIRYAWEKARGHH